MPAKESKASSAPKSFSLVFDEKLLAMYAALLKCRALSRRIESGRKQAQASIAAVVAVSIDLLPADTLSANGSYVLARFVKGARLKTILAGLSATSKPAGAAVIKAAMRAGRAHKAERKKKVAIAFCEDPSAARELWHESLHEAVSKRLPVVFVCHAGAKPTDKIPYAPDFHFPAIVVDSNDAVAIYRVASEAVTHARRGNGPTLIVCQPFCPATGKKAAVVDADPILNMEKYLGRKGLFNAELKAKTISGFARELRAAVAPKISA